MDLRDEVVNGDIIRVAGNDYVVTETERKITASSLPIKEVYMGRSLRSMPARSGKVSSEKNCEELRSVLLGEIVARTVKNLIRLQLRTYARKVKSISRQFIYGVTVEYLNVVTGSHSSSASRMIDVVLQEFTPSLWVTLGAALQNTYICSAWLPLLHFMW